MTRNDLMTARLQWSVMSVVVKALLSVSPPVMLDGVSVLRCCGLISWLTDGSLFTLLCGGEAEPNVG